MRKIHTVINVILLFIFIFETGLYANPALRVPLAGADTQEGLWHGNQRYHVAGGTLGEFLSHRKTLGELYATLLNFYAQIPQEGFFKKLLTDMVLKNREDCLEIVAIFDKASKTVNFLKEVHDLIGFIRGTLNPEEVKINNREALELALKNNPAVDKILLTKLFVQIESKQREWTLSGYTDGIALAEWIKNTLASGAAENENNGPVQLPETFYKDLYKSKNDLNLLKKVFFVCIKGESYIFKNSRGKSNYKAAAKKYYMADENNAIKWFSTLLLAFIYNDDRSFKFLSNNHTTTENIGSIAPRIDL